MNLVTLNINKSLLRGESIWRRDVEDDEAYWIATGKELMEERIAKGISRFDIAKQIGTSCAYLKKFETGVKIPHRLWLEVTYRMVLNNTLVDFIRNLVLQRKYNYFFSREMWADSIFSDWEYDPDSEYIRRIIPNSRYFNLIMLAAPELYYNRPYRRLDKKKMIL